jgi:hypothetical protein
MAVDGDSQYGACPCSGAYEQRWVEVRFSAKQPPVVLTNVPQGACPLCGSRVYKRHVLEYVEALMRWERPPHDATVTRG